MPLDVFLPLFSMIHEVYAENENLMFRKQGDGIDVKLFVLIYVLQALVIAEKRNFLKIKNLRLFFLNKLFQELAPFS